MTCCFSVLKKKDYFALPESTHFTIYEWKLRHKRNTKNEEMQNMQMWLFLH